MPLRISPPFMDFFPRSPRRRCSISMVLATFFLLALTTPSLFAGTISGTVQDPSGAVIAGATIEIAGELLANPISLASDALGKFTSPELKDGTYSLRVTRDGFESLTKTVDLQGNAQVQLTLAIAQQHVSINVPGKNLAFANSDPVYKQLRSVGLGQTYRVDNLTLTWDVGTFQLLKGTLTVLNPVEGVETGAIFVGEGHFNLKPVLHLDAMELERRTGSAEANEDFSEAVFRFTRLAWEKFVPGLGEKTATPGEAAAAFAHWQEKTRERREHPLALSQYLLRARLWTTWMPTSWPPSTILPTRSFSMLTSAAKNTKIYAFL